MVRVKSKAGARLTSRGSVGSERFQKDVGGLESAARQRLAFKIACANETWFSALPVRFLACLRHLFPSRLQAGSFGRVVEWADDRRAGCPTD